MRNVRVISLGLCLVFLGSWNNAGQTSDGTHLSIGQTIQEAIDKNLGLLVRRYNISIASAPIITGRLRQSRCSVLRSIISIFPCRTENLTAAGTKRMLTDFLIERGGWQSYHAGHEDVRESRSP